MYHIERSKSASRIKISTVGVLVGAAGGLRLSEVGEGVGDSVASGRSVDATPGASQCAGVEEAIPGIGRLNSIAGMEQVHARTKRTNGDRKKDKRFLDDRSALLFLMVGYPPGVDIFCSRAVTEEGFGSCSYHSRTNQFPIQVIRNWTTQTTPTRGWGGRMKESRFLMEAASAPSA